jgi:hypothetical protein
MIIQQVQYCFDNRPLEYGASSKLYLTQTFTVFKESFKIILSSTPGYPRCTIPLSYSTKIMYAFLTFPCALRAPIIPFSFILSPQQ